MVQIQSNIYIARKKIDSEPDLVTKLKLESELERLQQELEVKRFLFIETATNINLSKQDIDKKKTEFSEDLKDIADPLLDGIKQISERPRAIQELKDRINFLSDKLESSEKAKKRLLALEKENKEKQLDRAIDRSLKKIEEVQKSYKIELEDSQFKLLKMEKSEGGMLSDFSLSIFDFFKTKGKNLILALIVFGVIYWLLGIGQNRFISLFMIRLGKAVDEPARAQWMRRPLKVFYSVATFATALSLAVLTLYYLNDWVLVTAIMFLLAGIVWGSRNYFPQYFEMLKIVLNFGPVRENERVVFQGLPWKVKSLGYYCRLENPALSGGTLRVHTRELLNNYSRPVGDTEPWFPTRNDDWVELDDGTFGKVMMQSPEFVSVKLIGGQIKYFPTSEFLNKSPVNLSHDFGIEIVFGVDYQHQGKVLDEVRNNIKEHVQSKLYNEFENDRSHIKNFGVEFREAAASSLDFRIFLECEGSLGSRKQEIRRKLNSYLVDACNKHDYVIPFQQITIHKA